MLYSTNEYPVALQRNLWDLKSWERTGMTADVQYIIPTWLKSSRIRNSSIRTSRAALVACQNNTHEDAVAGVACSLSERGPQYERRQCCRLAAVATEATEKGDRTRQLFAQETPCGKCIFTHLNFLTNASVALALDGVAFRYAFCCDRVNAKFVSESHWWIINAVLDEGKDV